MRHARSFVRKHRTPLLAAAVTAVALLAVWLFLTNWYQHRLVEEIRAEGRARLEELTTQLRHKLDEHRARLEALATFVNPRASENVREAEFRTFARGLFGGQPVIRYVSVAPKGVRQLIYPREGNEAMLGRDLRGDANPAVRRAVEKAIASGELVSNGPRPLPAGGHAFALRKTVPEDGSVWGLVAIVLDPARLLETAGAAPVKRGFICGVRTASEEEPFFGHGAAFTEGAITSPVSVFDDSWEIALVPRNGFEEAVASEYRIFALLTLLAIVLITALVYTLTSHQSALQNVLKRRTEHLHRELEEHRRTEERLEAERRVLRAISDTSPLGILLLDEDGVFTFSNPAARELLRVSQSELHGRMFDSPDWQLVDLQGNPIGSEELPFSRVLESGETVRDFRIVIYAQEEYRVVSVNAALLPDSKAPNAGSARSGPEANAITGVVATVEDVSDLVTYENRLRSALHEREALLREVHHRVKNNLNIITSLLRLEQNRIETAEGAVAAFGDLGNRVYALAHLHQLLSHSQGVETIDLARFLREATERLRNLYDPHGHVAVDLYLADVSLHMDRAVPAGLLFTELFTMALDAASAAAAGPQRLRITLEHDQTGSIRLEVLDETGTESFNALESGSETLRPDIVQALVDQLLGTLEMETGSRAYARVTFSTGTPRAE